MSKSTGKSSCPPIHHNPQPAITTTILGRLVLSLLLMLLLPNSQSTTMTIVSGFQHTIPILSNVHQLWNVRLRMSPLPNAQDQQHIMIANNYTIIDNNNNNNDTIRFVPSQLVLQDVSLQYPATLARKLFSSVPLREYAIDHVSCRLESEIVLLQGASSSGKSALMKCIVASCGANERNKNKNKNESSRHKPTSGRVSIPNGARPILLADKPPFLNQHTVQTFLHNKCQECLSSTLSLFVPDYYPTTTETISSIVEVFCRLVHLDDPSLLAQTPSQLSPSESYRFQLALACLESSLSGLDDQAQHHDSSGINDEATSHHLVFLPAPIVFLDEWMDFETRDSSCKVEEALLHLVQETGAVVLCATHKPNLWNQLACVTSKITSQMTMCRGKILTLQQQPKR